jgi:intracellular sulfur oxidation DsrE/DsrF family protein
MEINSSSEFSGVSLSDQPSALTTEVTAPTSQRKDYHSQVTMIVTCKAITMLEHHGSRSRFTITMLEHHGSRFMICKSITMI